MSDIQAIRERHNDWEEIGFVRMGPNGAILAHADRATLLSALSAAEARAEAAEEMIALWEQFFDKHVAPEPMFFKPEVGALLKEIARFRAARTLKGTPDGR